MGLLHDESMSTPSLASDGRRVDGTEVLEEVVGPSSAWQTLSDGRFTAGSRDSRRTNVLRLARLHEQHRSFPDSERSKTIGWESKGQNRKSFGRESA